MDASSKLRIPTLHVTDIELPREFEKLYELAYNLWWTWSPRAHEVFAAIDREKWSLYRNPVELLINVDPRRWLALLADEDFLARYHRVSQELDDYLHAGDTWFARQHGEEPCAPVAYFSMEFGLHQSLTLYSGGLGVLSGDHCKSASDLGVPLVAVGLLYRRGYFQQAIDAEGVQQHIYPESDYTRLPQRPVSTLTGREVTVTVPLPGRDLKVKLWLAQVGRVPLVMLDTDLPENDPADRPMTNLLYVRGREMRLLQELVLGIGGVRALRTLGIEPRVWHLNEGHSALLQLERLRELVAGEKLDAAAARERIRRDTVFTTHTPVPAGNEQFDRPLVEKYLRGWCDEVGLTADELHRLGQAYDGEAAFNLTALGIRTASWINGVSRLNAQVTSRMWRHLFAGDDGQPIHPVTNGVHTLTWIGFEMRDLFYKHLGDQWPERLLAVDGWERVREIPDREVWAAHLTQKKRLGRFMRSRLREQMARHGSSPDELRAVAGFFDPEALVVGFARRFATYKRAALVFSDLQRLCRLVESDERPLQFVIAGKAHPADRPGQQLIRHIFELSRSESCLGRVFFLENYDMRMGRMLVQGVDVWLNTPRKPLEASGTSGQKAALNGALNFSILDGWWPEGYNGKNGWVIGNAHVETDEGRQDWEDAQSLYATLENEILPAYYERGEDDLPRRWIAMMKEAIATLTAPFSANRMVRDYVEQAYLPAARRGAA
jgi:starch phosphorylase